MKKKVTEAIDRLIKKIEDELLEGIRRS